MELGEIWLVVPGIDMGDGAGAENDEDTLGRGLVVRRALGVGLVRIDDRPDGRFPREIRRFISF